MIVPALEKRLQATRPLRAAVTLGSLALALLLGGAVIAAVGVNPLDAYAALCRGRSGPATASRRRRSRRSRSSSAA